MLKLKYACIKRIESLSLYSDLSLNSIMRVQQHLKLITKYLFYFLIRDIIERLVFIIISRNEAATHGEKYRLM